MICDEQGQASGGHGLKVGEVIAVYRRGRRRLNRDVPWSQEELAFACGTGQAHISRIESNQQRPELSTLMRICDALELSQVERAYVFALAGYEVAVPLPDEHAVDLVLARVGPLLDSYPYPVSLVDEGERQWYLNEFFATVFGVWYGTTDQRACLSRIQGRRVVEMFFDSETYAERLRCWEAYFADFDHVQTRLVALFWRAFRMRPHEPEMNRIVHRLKQNPAFLVRWQRLERGVSELLFVDHDTYRLNHPSLGCLQLHAWRTRAAVDERFIVGHCTPVDLPTSRALARLAEARPVAGRSPHVPV